MRLFRRAGASFSSDHGHGATSEQIRIGIFWSFFKKDRIEKSDYDSVIYPLTLLGWKLGLDFVPVIYTENDWNNRKGTLFYHNVQTDSIKIV